MSNIQISIDKINELNPLEIVQSPIVRDRFIQIYDTLWGAGTGTAAYERESIYFNTLLRDNDGGKLLRATKFSIFTAFLDLAVCGLSCEPGSHALCYLIGRNINIGTREHPTYEGRCVLTISGFGELVARARSGQIKYADNPVIVYEGDEFSFSESAGQKTINYTCHYPHTNQKIVAVFMKIVRNDNSVDYAVMHEEDWLRLQDYSLKNNQRRDRQGNIYGNANALYTSANGSIDPGFLVAKCIKHAFKAYPKVRIGRGSELQTQQVDQVEINDALYGISTNDSPEPPQPDEPAIADIDQATPIGITVQPDDSEGF